MSLEVGRIPAPEELVLTFALTLAYIFPCIEGINCNNGNWDMVVNTIYDSREVIDCSSEEHPLLVPWGNFTEPPQEQHLTQESYFRALSD